MPRPTFPATLLPAACALACVLAVRPGVAGAHPWHGRDVGLGVVLGEPTGLTLELRPESWSSVEIALGFGDFDEHADWADGLYLHVQYLVRPFELFHHHGLAVPFYLGIGGFVSDHDHDLGGDDIDVGVRAPIGLAFEFGPPVQLFFELALRAVIVDVGHDHGDHLDLGGALGFRVFF